MPKERKTKRKLPVTASTSSTSSTSSHPSGSSSNPASTRTLIRRFHVLIKRQNQLRRITQGSINARSELAIVEQEIEQLGGLEVYQRMSSIGQGADRGGGSEKVLIGWLKELGILEGTRNAHERLRLLEVGALKPDNYAACVSWIDTTPIDLHSRHSSIAEQDFLLLDASENHEKWDIVSLSLVLNFVPDAKDRGRMLRLTHTILRPEGYLFLALPLPCVLNSRYLTPEYLQGLMGAIGFAEVNAKWRQGGKMAYWIYQKSNTDPTMQTIHAYSKKTILRQGNRNNFVVLL